MVTESSLARTQDTSGTVKEVKTLEDTDGSHIQVMAVADASGNQVGITTNAFVVTTVDADGVVTGTPNSPLPVHDMKTETTLYQVLDVLNKICFQLSLITDYQTD